MKIYLVTAPLTNTNSPYPATAYLAKFLRGLGHEALQKDLGIELLHLLFQPRGLDRLKESFSNSCRPLDAYGKHFLDNFNLFRRYITVAMKLLQLKDESSSYLMINTDFVRNGPTARSYTWSKDIGEKSESMGLWDTALLRAGQYINDIVGAFCELDADFDLCGYGSSLVRQGTSFDPLAERLKLSTIFDDFLEELVPPILISNPDLLAISAPFSGNIYGAFRIAKLCKQARPDLPIVLGGGFPNTELRDLSEPRVFDFFDYVCLDDGEAPLKYLIEHLEGKRAKKDLKRSFFRANGAVRYVSNSQLPDEPHSRTGTPDYRGIDFANYFMDTTRGQHLNTVASTGYVTKSCKLTLAHGCYWRKCTFCDIHLDYVSRFEKTSAAEIVDRMEDLIATTGISSFHFVDEACPPVVLAGVAKLILERGLNVTWFGNIRFDPAFNRTLCKILADSGCIAVTGGLEVASDRILNLMNKGTTIAQVARVARFFSECGVKVHAYLMYGFPTQTEQEVIDSLEVVRQMFANGILSSGFWHRFMVTAHSPIGRTPEKFGALVHEDRTNTVIFARYSIPHIPSPFLDYKSLGLGLKKALASYSIGKGIDRDIGSWFSQEVPPTSLDSDFIRQSLLMRSNVEDEKSSRLTSETSNPLQVET